MSSLMCRGGLALSLALLCLAFAAAPAAAKEFPYILDPQLSLTGDCSTSAFDPVPDPDCKPTYPAPPNGPSARFNRPFGLATDAYGNVYVASYAAGPEGRIDIFDDEGHFISEFADPHGPEAIAVDSEGNLYAYERLPGGESELSRYPPKLPYEPEAGSIEYSQASRVVVDTEVHLNPFLNGLGIDFSNGHLYVAQDDQISEYSSASTGNTLLETIEPPGLKRATYVAVDSKRRRLYTETCKKPLSECGVKVLSADPPYSVLKDLYTFGPSPSEKFLSEQGWLGLGVDEETGHFFVGDTEATQNIYEFDPGTYERVSKFKVPNQIGPTGSNLQMAVANDPLEKPAGPANQGYLFVPIPFISGSALAYEPPEETEPEVKLLSATNISETEAQIGARVDPNGGDTEYTIEYVSEAQFEIDSFASAILVKSGTIPGAALPQQVGATLSGLTPGASYRFRVTAENGAGSDEEKGLFATYSDAAVTPPGLCPNGPLIEGPSALLPDCRAYELVTPPDTNGGSPTGAGFQGDRFGMVQSSPAGTEVSFELIGGSLPGIEATGGYHGDPYLASRGPGGWSTALVGPNGAEASKPQPGSFAPDQGHSFWLADGTGTAMVGGNPTHYIRYPDGHSELVGQGSIGTDIAAAGRLITEGATHIVFETGNFPGFPPVQLEPNAPPTGTKAVYDRTPDEVTHVVSLLPGDVTPTANSTYMGASPDGEGIAFLNEGKLYLRLHNQTTYEIGSGATYAGLAEGGTRIFYLQGGDLKAFDTTAGTITFADTTGPVTPVNVAPEGTRAYFVSEEAIAGSGPNPQGDEPQGTQQNLYLSEEGTISFIATVTKRDVEGEVISGTGVHLDGLGTWTEALEKSEPATDTSRLTPDGSVLLFQSRAELTGYEESKFPQVYRYDTAGRLDCLSCPPTKTPAAGGALLQSLASNNSQAPFSRYGLVPNLTPSGNRAFFESTEALVSGDTDGLRDVYEWEEEGVGSCTVPGGCVYLISSGHSERDDYLFGHSTSGDDVFFTTADVLVGGDEETLSVYDARAGGGFAQEPAVVCQGEGCRPNLTPPPSIPTPASESLGLLAGSEPLPAKPKHCPKGKHKVKRKGKYVCVKNKKKGKKHNRAAARRGASK